MSKMANSSVNFVVSRLALLFTIIKITSVLTEANWMKTFAATRDIRGSVIVAKSIKTRALNIEMSLNFSKTDIIPVQSVLVDAGPGKEIIEIIPRASKYAYTYIPMPQIRLDPGLRSDVCAYEGTDQQGVIRCDGKFGFQTGRSIRFFITIFTGNENIAMSYRFKMSVPRTRCEEVMPPFCRTFYSSTAFPNLFGHHSQQKALKILMPTFKMMQSYLSSCYKYFQYFGCLTAFPRCGNHTVRFPCREMCQDFLMGCASQLDSMGYHIRPEDVCQYFESYRAFDSCIYKEVDCGEPPMPKLGEASYNTTTAGSLVTYSCLDGHVMTGSRMAKCQVSGQWTKPVPECLAMTSPSSEKAIKITVTVIFVCLSIWTLCFVIYFYGERIKLSCYEQISMADENMMKDFKYHAFISFHKNEEDFILNEVVHNLEEKIEPAYRLCIHIRDFEPGASIADNIGNAILLSNKTVIFLSKGYLHNEWCLYEFQQVHYDVIHGRRDSLILVLMDEFDENELPPNIRSFMYTHTYIKYGHDMFWKRLSIALGKPGSLLEV